MRVKWTPPALASLNAYFAHLGEHAPSLTGKARAGIEKAVGRLGVRPLMGRPARWPGLREWSLLRWKKIVVYRVKDDRIEILAFYDARQDLSRLTPGE